MQNFHNLNIVSIDIEDWYLSYDSSQIPVAKWESLESRVETGTLQFLDLLTRNQQKATFFILGWIAERHPDLIKEILRQGHEIGYHSYYHQLPHNQGAAQFENDLVKGLELLETITGSPITQYRAPMFSINHDGNWCIPILLKHGITISSSLKSYSAFQGQHIPASPFFFEHAGNRLLEFPLNRLPLPFFNWVYSGSGYLRILPVRLIRKLMEWRKYNMVYFHPRDFDVNVPHVHDLPAYRNLMNTIGNKTSYPKMEYLFGKFHFVSCGEAAAHLSSRNDLPVINV